MTYNQLRYRAYLRSPHWKNLRRRKLIACSSRCEMCGCQHVGNDVHHVEDHNLHDVELDDLRVLCRDDHELVHQIIKEYPSIKRIPSAKLKWKQLTSILQKRKIGDREYSPFRYTTPTQQRKINRNALKMMATQRATPAPLKLTPTQQKLWNESIRKSAHGLAGVKWDGALAYIEGYQSKRKSLDINHD